MSVVKLARGRPYGWYTRQWNYTDACTTHTVFLAPIFTTLVNAQHPDVKISVTILTKIGQ